MSLKQAFPLVILCLFGAALVGFLLFTRERPAEKIDRAALAYARGRLAKTPRVEGRDYAIGTIEVLFRDDARAVVDVPIKPMSDGGASAVEHLLLELRHKEGEWGVERDLREHFTQTARHGTFVRGVALRLARLYAEKYRMKVEIKEGTPFATHVARERGEVVGTFEFRYAIPRVDGKFNRGRYLERFVYQDGEWKQDGPGGLFEAWSPR